MLSFDQFKAVLWSPELRRAHSLELPDASLAVLLNDDTQLTAFYERWNAQGQPKYVAPVAAPEPVAPAEPVVPPEPVAPPAPPAAPAFVPVTSGIPPVPVAPLPSAPNAGPASVAPPVPTPPAPPAAPTPYGSPPPAYLPVGQSAAKPSIAPIVIGFGLALVGVLITGITYSLAAPGGTFVVSWGLIVVGLIRGILGVVRYNRQG